MDVREALTAAAEQIESTPEPAQEAAPAAEAPPEPAAAAETAPAEPTAATKAPARDEAGRFARKAAEAATAKAGGDTPATLPTPAVTPAPPEPKPAPAKAPQSWKPVARELAAKLPPEFAPILEEVSRREAETSRVLQESADARKFRERFEATFRPYEGFMRAAGHEPIESLANLAQTAAALQSGPPAHKAQIVAQIIRGYGVDVNALAAALDGAPMPQQQYAPQPQDIERVVQSTIQRQIAAAQEQRWAKQAETSLAKAKGELEFFDDVGEQRIATLAASLLESDPALTLDDALRQAYDALAQVTPSVKGVLEQRRAAQSAATANAATQRARTAASSVRSSPAPAPAAKPVGERAALQAAAERLGM